MNILVYNIAAEYAGAMTILENFYNEALSHPDKSIRWIFLVSTDRLESRDNVEVLSVPWVKKSWLHRMYYDRFCVQKVVKERNIDLVYSMQNMPVKHTKAKQVVYLHQSLQFSPVRFSLKDAEQRGYAIRQRIVCNIYKRNLRFSDRIIVQTNWMKEASADWIPFDKTKISVVNPTVTMPEELLKTEYQLKEPVFFYPAGDGVHKNHKLILEACRLLKEDGIENYRIIFTLDTATAEYSRRIQEIVDNEALPIQLVGIIPKEEVYEMYTHSVLLFPSYLETFGLPMLEAKKLGAVILASDMPFSHEILDGYPNARFYGIDDAPALYRYMKDMIAGILPYQKVSPQQSAADTKTIIDCILE